MNLAKKILTLSAKDPNFLNATRLTQEHVVHKIVQQYLFTATHRKM